MNPVSHTPLTPLSFLERTARVWPDKPGVIYGNRSLSYAELAAQATRVARALQAGGIGPGDRVAYLMPNVPEMLIAHFAVPLAGAVLVAVNTRLSAQEIAYILDHSGAKVLIADAAYLRTVAAAVRDVETVTEVVVHEDIEAGVGTDAAAVAAIGSRLVSYGDFTARGSEEPLDWSVEDELAPISINYTSGTTGRPRGVVYTHRGAYLNSFGEIVHSSHDQDSVYLWTLPMFHCNGWCTPWAVTGIGGTHVCLREVRGDAIWQLIRKHRVTHLNGAPTVVTTILNAAEAGPLDYRLVITTAGAPPSPTTILQMERMGFGIVHVYGLTESYGPYSVCQPQPQWSALPPQQRAAVQARQGVGMIQTDGLRVVDVRMADVPADGSTMGEIVMRGNNLMSGYYRDPNGTAKAFRGGWFHSGDLGVMHSDGYVELRDRAKDVVISGGENISTIEVEQALMSHEAVLEVAVVGVPDEKWGERPKAFVVLKAGRQATEEELIEHVRMKIARYKVPRNVDLVAELPKTSTGKIQKYALREPEWAGHSHRVQG
ncbi:acyl--CoA ligase family protein [Actinacidiphila oryziradicis]|uniref:Long-chain-fatty-acid--CoA ligase n=1 Tax=Actinacidiphila oryziradicis TaxID=2571141 RepID=A0A4U0S8A4_9ACTN|nr:acyl--CoA ligase family protein [Actinacidiphila oryziradicis]TKA04628.1 long-chain-fatty-acid--CoA ligase [Actinacidiphila oryziradicis]